MKIKLCTNFSLYSLFAIAPDFILQYSFFLSFFLSPPLFLNPSLCPSLLSLHLSLSSSVEGSGNATILDVIYETKSEEPSDNDGKKEEIDGLSEEIKDKKKELATIEFQQVLIDRQKNILIEFSGHVTSGGQDKKVSIF